MKILLLILLLTACSNEISAGIYEALKDEPEQYVLLNFNNPSPETFREIASAFGKYRGGPVKIGVGVIVSYLNYTPQEAASRLRNYLSLSEQYDLPLIVQLDGEQWWNKRPDLWNWWDPDKPGYDPENKNNVEWTGWSPDDAVKIGWRNWGRQLRVLPMPNLMSAAYRQACYDEMEKLVPIVMEWQQQLPPEKKHLLVGVKVGWESAIGVNNWYYPNGNELLDQPGKNDPQYGLTPDSLPGRGVEGIGYAAVSSLGLADSGELTEAHITEVVRQHLEGLTKLCADLGVPRNKLFTHCGGWSQGEKLYTAAVNDYSCPGWSFYDYAGMPENDLTAMKALAQSDAPYWGAVEWLYKGKTKAEWTSALKNTLKNPRIRYLCIYNWEGIKDNNSAIKAIRKISKSRYKNE